MVGIIPGATAGVSCIVMLLIVIVLWRRRRYSNDSRETIDTHTTEISVPPPWIQMIDTMKKNNYNPIFLEYESH